MELSDLNEAEENEDAVFIGDGAGRFIEDDERYIKGYELIDPEVIAKLAFKLHEAGEIREIEPLYLRGADVSKPKNKQRVILDD